MAKRHRSREERGFRHFKLADLQVRPVYHYLERRVKAHLLVCMLAYLVQRGLEKAWAPLLFVDEAPPQPRRVGVAPASRSEGARHTEHHRVTSEGFPVHSFRTLLADLGTIVKNRVIPRGADEQAAFDLVTLPTTLQARVFEMLGLQLGRS